MVCVSGAMSFCCNTTTVWSFFMFFISICSDQSWNCTYQGIYTLKLNSTQAEISIICDLVSSNKYT